jgi:ATP phosphoribosyltransferase regulatory subunit HisZ
MLNAKLTGGKWNLDTLLEAHDRMISRMEDKGESIDVAAEAVCDDYGGLAFAHALIAFAQGDKSVVKQD